MPEILKIIFLDQGFPRGINHKSHLSTAFSSFYIFSIFYFPKENARWFFPPGFRPKGRREKFEINGDTRLYSCSQQISGIVSLLLGDWRYEASGFFFSAINSFSFFSLCLPFLLSALINICLSLFVYRVKHVSDVDDFLISLSLSISLVNSENLDHVSWFLFLFYPPLFI